MQAFRASGLVFSIPTNQGDGQSSEARISVDFNRPYQMAVSGTIAINALVGAPFVFAGIPKIYGLVLYAPNGETLTALITSSAGIDQPVQFSNTLMVHSPATEMTAVKIYGTGTVEYLIAGSA